MKLRHSPQKIALLVFGIIIVIVCVILLVKNRTEKTPVSENPYEDRIVVELTTTPETRKIEKKEKTYEYSIEYPYFGNVAVDVEIQKYVDNAHDSFEADLKASYYPEAMNNFTPIGEIDYVLKKSGAMTTVVFNGYQYTGGAHPNPFVGTLSFQGEQKIILDSLFSVPQSEYLVRLQTIATSSLEQKLGKGSLFYEGLEPRIENWENWYVIDNALVILFSPYQVGPYAIGMPEVTIPFTQIQDILK